MMEERLYQAAKKLPEPGSDFLCIEEQVKKTVKSKSANRKRKLVILAVALSLFITACAYSTTKYGLWGGYSSTSLKDAKQAALKFDYELPETMNGSPFQTFSTAHGAPEGASHLQALLSPTYKLYTVRYYVEKKEQREEGEHHWAENTVSISFGTTENERWKYHFSVAEDGSKNYHGVNPGSTAIAEYEGYQLHLYSIGKCHSVMWEDKERKMIIDLTCYDLESQEEVVEIAKILIDLNREASVQ